MKLKTPLVRFEIHQQTSWCLPSDRVGSEKGLRNSQVNSLSPLIAENRYQIVWMLQQRDDIMKELFQEMTQKEPDFFNISSNNISNTLLPSASFVHLSVSKFLQNCYTIGKFNKDTHILNGLCVHLQKCSSVKSCGDNNVSTMLNTSTSPFSGNETVLIDDTRELCLGDDATQKIEQEKQVFFLVSKMHPSRALQGLFSFLTLFIRFSGFCRLFFPS